jgi:arylsulfatase A-like enzyme
LPTLDCSLGAGWNGREHSQIVTRRLVAMASIPVRTLVSSCAWIVLSVATCLAAEGRKPNIVLFLVDDMGWMDSTPYGSQYYKTPAMDRFARQAMRFTDAYACPLCSPTRASLLTGKYSARHGITTASGHQPPQPEGHSFLPESAAPNRPIVTPESKNYLEPAEYTLAEALQDAGYRTGHFGKWHLGLTEPHWPERQGFDVAFHGHPDPGPPSYFSPYRFKAGTITDGPTGEYITDRVTDEAIQFIEANRDRPFFLNLWHYGVHGPWGHKEESTQRFAEQRDPRGQQGNPIMASMLKSVDDSLARVLDALQRLDLTGDTIFIFTSDNGGNVHSNTPADRRSQRGAANAAVAARLADWRKWAGERPPTNNHPLRAGKGTLYEGGVRVPLMVAWPGVIPPGSTSNAVVAAIDVYPTLLELAGLPRPEQQKIDGVSYTAVLKQSGPWNRSAYFTYFPHGGPAKPPGVTVRAGDWKLIRWFETGPQYPSRHELYNLRDDLGEQQNLAAQMPEKVRELDSMIDAFLKDTGALAPRPNPAHRASR